MYFVKFFI
jgi:hypothetical protein